MLILKCGLLWHNFAQTIYLTRKMKQIENLSDYYADQNGNVYEMDTQEQIPLLYNKFQGRQDYKLLTDETVRLETKGKTIRLWRRFTREEIIKLYNSAKAKPIDFGTSLKQPAGQVENYQNSGQVERVSLGQVDFSGQVATKQGTSSKIKINGIIYDSINSAANELAINRKVIKKRLDDEFNGDYTYL